MFTPADRDLPRGWPGRIEGDRVIQLAAQTLQSFFTGGGVAREHAEFRLDEVRLLPPVLHPPSVRSFDAFKDALDFQFSNPAAIRGPDDVIPYPLCTDELDHELEIAAIVGAEGRIGGFTIMNDWAARDLAPAKDRDFATSLGPVVVTPDELDDSGAELAVRVNGEERSRGRLCDLRHSWDAIVSHAAHDTLLRAGDVIGSGTFAAARGPWLRPGDEVELEVEGIGVLRNRIGLGQ